MDMDVFHRDFKRHTKEDDRRFSRIDRKLALTSGKLNVVIALVIAAVVMLAERH